jgi:hypothetical protein
MARRAPLVLLLLPLLLCAACGGPGAGSTPGEDTAVPLDTIAEVSSDTPCLPDCEGRECGDDGCGGVCGTCTGDKSCTDDGICAPECGNGLCKAFENCKSCPADCGECCGNGTCDGGWGETCGTCAEDCGCAGYGLCLDGECAACFETAQVEGGFAWACADHADCLSGLCVPDDDGAFCSCPCTTETDCPGGWACEISDLFGTDLLFVCMPECDLPLLTGQAWIIEFLTIYNPTGPLTALLPPQIKLTPAGIFPLLRVDAHDITLGTFEILVGYGTAETAVEGDVTYVTDISFAEQPATVNAHLEGCSLVMDGPFDIPLAAPNLTAPLWIHAETAQALLQSGGDMLWDLHVHGAVDFSTLEALCGELTGFETANLHEVLFAQGICPDVDIDGDESPDGIAIELGLDGPQTQVWSPGYLPYPFLDMECAPHTEVCGP